MSGMLGSRPGGKRAENAVTIGNIAGALAVSVLIVLSQAGDARRSTSRPTNGAASREPVRGDPVPAPGSGASPRPAEVAPPPVVSPQTSVAARPTEPPPSTRANAPAAEAPGGRSAPTQAEPEAESPSQKEREAAQRTETAPATAPPPPQSAGPAAVATLDLSSLEQRLRETKAIGVFTKLSLKNQVDDLLEEFHEFHRSRDQAMLGKLRQSYDLLLLKVLSLLQDDDPALARDISSSREALWKVLTDPDRFERL
jgi:hypothetical protein